MSASEGKSASDRRNASDEPLPRAFGRYVLLERIGVGGMAEVFRASSPDHARPVVVKRLRNDRTADDSMSHMFIDEARLALELHHPNIVSVYALDRDECGQLYMVMEHVDGPDLKQMLRAAECARFRIPVWFSVWMMTEVLAALEYVHGLTDARRELRRIVHRDVSPENVFLSRRGEIKLGDFGIAKYEQRMTRTSEGRIKGKLCYMSPEQIRNHPIDARTDVFAAAVVLWECLTQRRLFRGQSAFEVLEKICLGGRLPPSALAADVPPSLDACVLVALAEDPNRRTSTARDFRDQLLCILDGMHSPVLREEVGGIVGALSETPPPPDMAKTALAVTAAGGGQSAGDLGSGMGSTARVRPPEP